MTFGMEKGGRGIQTGAVLYFGGTLWQTFKVASDILKQIPCCNDDDELRYDYCQDSSYSDFLSYCGFMCVLFPVMCFSRPNVQPLGPTARPLRHQVPVPAQFCKTSSCCLCFWTFVNWTSFRFLQTRSRFLSRMPN